MEPLTLALLLGGINAAQGIFNTSKESKQLKDKAAIDRWSPWTGRTGSEPTARGEGALSGLARGGLSGYLQGSAMEDTNSVNKLLAARLAQDLQNSTPDATPQTRVASASNLNVPSQQGYTLGGIMNDPGLNFGYRRF